VPYDTPLAERYRRACRMSRDDCGLCLAPNPVADDMDRYSMSYHEERGTDTPWLRCYWCINFYHLHCYREAWGMAREEVEFYKKEGGTLKCFNCCVPNCGHRVRSPFETVCGLRHAWDREDKPTPSQEIDPLLRPSSSSSSSPDPTPPPVRPTVEKRPQTRRPPVKVKPAFPVLPFATVGEPRRPPVRPKVEKTRRPPVKVKPVFPMLLFASLGQPRQPPARPKKQEPGQPPVGPKDEKKTENKTLFTTISKK